MCGGSLLSTGALPWEGARVNGRLFLPWLVRRPRDKPPEADSSTTWRRHLQTQKHTHFRPHFNNTVSLASDTQYKWLVVR